LRSFLYFLSNVEECMRADCKKIHISFSKNLHAENIKSQQTEKKPFKE